MNAWVLFWFMCFLVDGFHVAGTGENKAVPMFIATLAAVWCWK